MRYLFLIALFVTGCTSFHEKPLPESDTTSLIVEIVWVESDSDFPLRNAYREDQRGLAVYADGFDGKRWCKIYAYKPYGVDDFKHLNTLGHELLHCTDGRYHGVERRKNGSEILEEIMDRP